MNPAGRPSEGRSMGRPLMPVKGPKPGVGWPIDEGGAGSAIGGGAGGTLSASLALKRLGWDSWDGEPSDWDSARDCFHPLTTKLM